MHKRDFHSTKKASEVLRQFPQNWQFLNFVEQPEPYLPVASCFSKSVTMAFNSSSVEAE